MTPQAGYKFALVFIGIMIGVTIGLLVTLPLTGTQGAISVFILVIAIGMMKEHFWDAKSPSEEYLNCIINEKDEMVKDLRNKLIVAHQDTLWRKRFQDSVEKKGKKASSKKDKGISSSTKNCLSIGSPIPAESVLPYLCDREDKKMFNGCMVNTRSPRLGCFKRSLVCANCGRTGDVFVVEYFPSTRPTPQPHLNLYSVQRDGQFVLMTKDHIKPAAHGGLENPENLQTMCEPCNYAKGSNWTNLGGE